MIVGIGLAILGLIVLTAFVTFQQWQLGRMFHSRTWGWFVAAYLCFLAGMVRVGWLFSEAFMQESNYVIEPSQQTVWRVVLAFAPSYGFLICKAIGNHMLRVGFNRIAGKKH